MDDTYFSHHVDCHNAECLIVPYTGTLGMESGSDLGQEDHDHVNFDDEEFYRVLSADFSCQVPLMTDAEYAAEAIENREYDQQARAYEQMLHRREASGDSIVAPRSRRWWRDGHTSSDDDE